MAIRVEAVRMGSLFFWKNPNPSYNAEKGPGAKGPQSPGCQNQTPR